MEASAREMILLTYVYLKGVRFIVRNTTDAVFVNVKIHE